MALSDSYVILDPNTGRVIDAESPTVQEKRGQEFFDIEDTFKQEDVDISNPGDSVHIPAPEYFAQDGKTPIYKIFKKSPYGH